MGWKWCLMKAEAAAGSQADSHWSFEPAEQSDPDADTYPELLPPMVGEHVEQSVLPFGILRRLASVEEVRQGDDVF